MFKDFNIEDDLDNVEVIETVDLLASKFSPYVKYSLQDRAIPDGRDGLKPVQRRILYSMFEDGNLPTKPYRKSAKSVGSIMGNYHPHGDSSIYEAMIRMSQNWVTGVPLIEVHGNNGSIENDPPAAMRYTEARLTKFSIEALLSDLKKKDIIAVKNNFDNTTTEPLVLPAKIPNLLVNGASGVSVGYKTEIPPHNLCECLSGSVELFKNPNLTIEELHQIIPAPDFPTGGVIIGAKNSNSYFETGIGKITVRAKYHIERTKKTNNIVFTEIPYGVNKTTILKELELLVKSDKKERIAGLLSLEEETDKDDIRIVLVCSNTVPVEPILAKLFSTSKYGLQINISALMLAIIDKKPKFVGVRDALIAYNNFRKELEIKILNADLLKLKNRLHIVEGLIKLADIIDDVIQVIKASNGKSQASKNIQKEFEFTEIQADTIVSMPLHSINKTDVSKTLKEQREILREIKRIGTLLNNDKKLVQSIVDQTIDLMEQFPTPRKTEVIQEDETWEVSKVDTVVEESVAVGVSKMGYIKTATLRSYKSTETVDTVEGDEILLEQETTNKSYLVIFTNKCNYVYLPIHELPDTKWKPIGKHMNTMISGLEDGETVVNAFVIDPEKDFEKYIFTVKSDGKVKRTTVAEHEVVRKFFSTFVAIKAKDGEELIHAELTDGDEGFIGFKDSQGKVMYFSLGEVAPKGLKTDGMRGINLKDGDTISETLFSTNEQDLIKAGYVKKNRGSVGAKAK